MLFTGYGEVQMDTLEAFTDLVEEAYRRPAWHGPNLRDAARGFDAAQSLWQPAQERHSVWALVLHCAYWKHRVICRITGKRERFPHQGKDWPAIPGTRDEPSWLSDLELLDRCHERLCDVVRGLPPPRLDQPALGHRQTVAELIRGIALHDVYHAGQIRLVRKLGEACSWRGTC